MCSDIKEEPVRLGDEPLMQKAPNEIIHQIFKILRQEHMDAWCYHGAFSKSDGILRAISLGLSCRQYWNVFCEIWCDKGTHCVSDQLELHQKLSLSTLLKDWVGPAYRCASYLSWETTPVPMFLLREIYGETGSIAETRLVERYSDYLAIYSCTATQDNSDLPLSRVSHPYHAKRGVLSPLGLGEEWYVSAAMQYAAGIFWYQLTFDKRWECGSASRNSNRNRSWEQFRLSSLYQWVHAEDCQDSPAEADVKEWLKWFEGCYDNRIDSRDQDDYHVRRSGSSEDSDYLSHCSTGVDSNSDDDGVTPVVARKYKDPKGLKWRVMQDDVLSCIERLYDIDLV